MKFDVRKVQAEIENKTREKSCSSFSDTYLEPVDKDRAATFGGLRLATKGLQAWRIAVIRSVRVRVQCLRGVGCIVHRLRSLWRRIPDSMAPGRVKSAANGAKERGGRHQRVHFRRHVLQHDNAVADECLERRFEAGVVRRPRYAGEVEAFLSLASTVPQLNIASRT